MSDDAHDTKPMKPRHFILWLAAVGVGIAILTRFKRPERLMFGIWFYTLTFAICFVGCVAYFFKYRKPRLFVEAILFLLLVALGSGAIWLTR